MEFNQSFWYVIRVKSRFEKKSYESLIKSGIECYLPLQKQKRTWSDRIKEVEVPLFNGYLFVKSNEKVRFQILNTQGVVNFINFSGVYATVRQSEIDMIEKLLRNESCIEVVDSELMPGQEVLITSGPFKNTSARLVHHNGKGRLLLEVESIGKGVLLEIKQAWIEKREKLSA
jgi:transcription antitermination factor NusG